MHPILNNIVWILTGMLVIYLFTKGKQLILKRVSHKVKKVSGFDSKKFSSGFFNVFNPVLWAKDVISIFNLRKLIIFGVIFAVVAGFFYWQGTLGKPVTIDIGYGKEAFIKVDGHYLHIDKTGHVFLEDKDGTKLKQISVKDIPALKRKLSPIGIEFKPIAVAGYGVGEWDSGFEGGVGISFLRYWSWRLEAFMTNKGVYLGTSYKLTKFKLENSSIGIGAGKGWQGDNRILIYFRMEF